MELKIVFGKKFIWTFMHSQKCEIQWNQMNPRDNFVKD